jgi:HlyD family secretion protein
VEPEPPEEGASPTAAVRPRGKEQEGVFVVKDGLAAFKAVQTGILGETDIEIVKGLSEGDDVVTGSYKTLRTLKDASRIKLETKKK